MHEEQFINEVQTRAGLAARGDAQRAIQATLEILGEQLPGNLVGPVAAALPERLGDHLWHTRPRSQVTGAQAGRLSRGVARGEGSWPGDDTVADADIDHFPRQRAQPSA
ncbi:MAG: DUF2267 domain-containing protein [Actinomycetota bacterium]|jgi:uncharacterized protein (DUF2267 family)|nr:DUF2267 domain-containing protein [Actinomycetota bacterium]